jgi:hypothetical protein
MITTTKFANIFCYLQPKAKAPQPSTQVFPTKGNYTKNVKKKEHDADKKELLQAHVVQVQILQNELKSLKAQIVNLKGKSSQPTNHAQPVQGSGSWEGPPRSFYGLSHDAMVGNMVFPMHIMLVSHQNLPLLFAIPTLQHKKLMWHPEFLPLRK